MNINELRSIVSEKLSKRDYYGMFEIINNASNDYLQQSVRDFEYCVELITQNQDLFEYLGSSKQFESDFELNKQVRKNRNRLFLSCLDEQPELKPLFKRCVGDFSQEY